MESLIKRLGDVLSRSSTERRLAASQEALTRYISQMKRVEGGVQNMVMAADTSVELGADIFGTMGLSIDADDFHNLLLGRLKIAAAISQRKLVVRGSLSRLMQSSLLLSLAPYLYPPYFDSQGRSLLELPTNNRALGALKGILKNSLRF